MRNLLPLLVLFAAATVHAQATPSPAPVAPVAPHAPDVGDEPAPARPAPSEAVPEAGDTADEDEDEDERARDTPGPFWAGAAAGALPCLAVDVVGGALTGLGCVFAHLTPDGGSGNCVEACVVGAITAGLVVLGLVLGGAGLLLLGPVGAIIVTIAATVGSAIAGRAFWGAALGGVPGVLVGIAGVVLAGLAVSEMSIGDGLEPGLFSSDPRSALLLGGLGLAASAGVVSLLGALVGDVAFTAFMAPPDEQASTRREVSRPRPPNEVPLALHETTLAPVAY